MATGSFAKMTSSGWAIQPTDMFYIKVDYTSAKGFIDPDEFYDTTKKTAHDNSEALIDVGGKYLLRRLKDRLEPPPKGEHGASGKARDNIFYKGEHTSSGYNATIYEGSYVGNAFIRSGRLSHTEDQLDNTPTVGAIVNWMIVKNIPVKQPEKQATWRMTKYGGLRADRRNKPSRPWKADLRLIALIIAQHINIMGVAPYDYYAETFNQDSRTMTNKMEKTGILYLNPYFEFLTTGFYRPKIGPRQEIII